MSDAARPSPLWLAERGPLLVVAVGGTAVLVLLALGAMAPVSDWSSSGGPVLIVAAATAAIAMWAVARRPNAWPGTRWAAGAVGSVALLRAVGFVTSQGTDGSMEVDVVSASMMLVLVAFLGTFVIDFNDHAREDRMALLSDIALVAVVTGCVSFLLFHVPLVHDTSPWELGLAVGLVGVGVVLVSGWAVLSLWFPSAVHFSLSACGMLAALAGVSLQRARFLGLTSTDALAGQESAAAAAILALAALLVVEPRLNPGARRSPRLAWWIRPALLTVCLGVVCVMVIVAALYRDSTILGGGRLVLISVIFTAVAARSLANQYELARTTKMLAQSLHERSTAIESLSSATDILRDSDARHRLLLSAAVDGIVELDADGVIVRVNDAFCAMVNLSAEEAVGRRWGEMAALAGGNPSLITLPETGEATVVTDRGTAHLEARKSVVPTNPPGTLLLIRDVTASKVSEQTIRSLFQFLQNRDEDRTRLLTRTNTAIENERNRIARDLHDGPVQGISAAALSLEAARLMVEKGDMTRAAKMLQSISSELSEEALNLRRVMSDLRPPVLEERGLIPAVYELAARVQREMGIPVNVQAMSNSEVPEEVETIAYRVLQEALSNVGKHAQATRVDVRIEVSAGTLRVTVEDNGRGFDPEAARDFLRRGKVGLASMRERAELVGGTFTIRSSRGGGTAVMASLPFEILPRLADA
ncbi:MAG TPA: ATP-binding protein [Actinomycetota bacterium]|nr:ATP-binding protein [Actinomycetota bacterium]